MDKNNPFPGTWIVKRELYEKKKRKEKKSVYINEVL